MDNTIKLLEIITSFILRHPVWSVLIYLFILKPDVNINTK